MQNKVSRHCLEGERIREGKGKCRRASLPGPGNFCLPPGRCQPHQEVPGTSPEPPPLAAGVTHLGTECGFVGQVCWPGVSQPSSGPASGVRTLTVPILQVRSTRLRIASSWQVTRMVWKNISFPGPSLGSLHVPLFACFHGSN